MRARTLPASLWTGFGATTACLCWSCSTDAYGVPRRVCYCGLAGPACSPVPGLVGHCWAGRVLGVAAAWRVTGAFLRATMLALDEAKSRRFAMCAPSAAALRRLPVPPVAAPFADLGLIARRAHEVGRGCAPRRCCASAAPAVPLALSFRARCRSVAASGAPAALYRFSVAGLGLRWGAFGGPVSRLSSALLGRCLL